MTRSSKDKKSSLFLSHLPVPNLFFARIRIFLIQRHPKHVTNVSFGSFDVVTRVQDESHTRHRSIDTFSFFLSIDPIQRLDEITKRYRTRETREIGRVRGGIGDGSSTMGSSCRLACVHESRRTCETAPRALRNLSQHRGHFSMERCVAP